MCFDRNINGNKDVKFLECDYLSCVMVCETHFSTNSLSAKFPPILNDLHADEKNQATSQKKFEWVKQLIKHLCLYIFRCFW